MRYKNLRHRIMEASNSSFPRTYKPSELKSLYSRGQEDYPTDDGGLSFKSGKYEIEVKIFDGIMYISSKKDRYETDEFAMYRFDSRKKLWVKEDYKARDIGKGWVPPPV